MSTPISDILAQLIRNIDRTETVNLTPGQIISLLVKQIEGSQALLTYQGRFLMAQMEAPLVPGERIRCIVEGERDGKILLKLLPDNSPPPEDAGSRVLGALLKELGLPVTEKNQQIVQELMRQELPATKENIHAVSQLAQKTGAAPTDLDVLAFVYKQEIPVTAKSFDLIRAAFKERDFLNAPLETLRQQLSALVRELPAVSELRVLSEKIVTLLDKMTFKQDEVSGQIRTRLADVPRLLGMSALARFPSIGFGQPGYGVLAELADRLPPELRQRFMERLMPALKEAGDAVITAKEAAAPKDGIPIKDAIPLKESIPPKDGAPLRDGVPSKEGIIAKENVVIKDGILTKDSISTKDGIILKDGLPPKEKATPGEAPISKEATMPKEATTPKELTGPKDVTTPKGGAILEDGENLPVLLNKLKGFLKGESIREKTLETVISNVQERLNTLETLQRPAGLHQEGLFLLQSAFRVGEKNYPLEMMVKYHKEKNSQAIDYSRCHVYVTLATVNLGRIQAAVQVSGKNLNCRFTAENENACQAIQKWLPDLTEKLAQLGYNVTMLPGRVRENTPPPGLSPLTDRPGIRQVDITV